MVSLGLVLSASNHSANLAETSNEAFCTSSDDKSEIGQRDRLKGLMMNEGGSGACTPGEYAIGEIRVYVKRGRLRREVAWKSRWVRDQALH
ncbi:uncharacterized protein BT62DRAFT_1000690 [Guyanagaster necrorhizus]|uniref:Uncharacterized protein n=1 Tax=Guyanagaster necrorhizus TaxID=856835 RepID=A0A9P7W3S0_9AGAR|nr:uncharacterized protein BT62DRAFT_1000690 [Guyanagaster necrorhizus MCA 3950]KAG7451440.1 hypothetical protein BT62DRAFT_1000690 [Guyanagaster necrorhizus MCA 3950]